MTNITLDELEIKDRCVEKVDLMEDVDRYYSAAAVASIFGKTKQAIHQLILKNVFDTAVFYKKPKYHSWWVDRDEVDYLESAMAGMTKEEKNGQKFTSLLLSAKER